MDSDCGSSDDEWEESTLSVDPDPGKNADAQSSGRNPVASDMPSIENINNLASSVEIINMENEQNGLSLYRCEPAKGNPPGIVIPVELKHYKFLHVSIHLINGTVPTHMRLPDPKKKNVLFSRCLDSDGMERGAFISTIGTSDTLYFKKKCINKHSGLDTAFQLGKGFASNTGGITPQFCIVLTPWVVNGFAQDKAVRTDRFYIFSKRQDRYLDAKKKRPRKNVEIKRLDTDIDAAESTLRILQEQFLRIRHKNIGSEQLFGRIREKLFVMDDSTTKIALTFSTRPLIQKDEVVEL